MNFILFIYYFNSIFFIRIFIARMINNFRNAFGSPSEVVVCIGDWSLKNQRRHHAPCKGIGFRKVFRKNHFKVYLVDEYKTSSKCNNCKSANSNEGICLPFREVENPVRSLRETIPKTLCLGLLKCQTCGRLWNRDVNAASNIWRIAKNAVLANNLDWNGLHICIFATTPSPPG